MSTKCQYRPTSSTRRARSAGSRPVSDIPYSVSSMRIPTVTWAPWKPVRTKKLDPNRLRDSVRPSLTNTVNSKTCPPTNVMPRSAVASSHARSRRWSPRWIALSASTMVRLDIRSTNEDTEVYGMSYTSSGYGPWTLLPRYSRYVAISDPKKRHSDPRNAHIPSLRLSSPVAVWGTATASRLVPTLLLRHRLKAPPEQPRQRDQPAHHGHGPEVDQAVADHRQAQGRHQGGVRGGR